MNQELYQKKVQRLKKVTDYLTVGFIISSLLSLFFINSSYAAVIMASGLIMAFVTFVFSIHLKWGYDEKFVDSVSTVKAEILSVHKSDRGYVVEYKLGNTVSLYNTSKAEVTTGNSYALVKEIRNVDSLADRVHSFELFLNPEDKIIIQN